MRGQAKLSGPLNTKARLSRAMAAIPHAPLELERCEYSLSLHGGFTATKGKSATILCHLEGSLKYSVLRYCVHSEARDHEVGSSFPEFVASQMSFGTDKQQDSGLLSSERLFCTDRIEKEHCGKIDLRTSSRSKWIKRTMMRSCMTSNVAYWQVAVGILAGYFAYGGKRISVVIDTLRCLKIKIMAVLKVTRIKQNMLRK